MAKSMEAQIESMEQKIAILKGELSYKWDDNKARKLKTLKRRLKGREKIFEEGL